MTFSQHQYTVLNLNSTGIFKHRDSIVELALVRVDSQGQIGKTYTTLIKPTRTPLDQIFLHQSSGLTAMELTDAPVFADVAGDILDMIKDTVIVAHSAQLDLGFVYEEFSRIGHDLPHLPAICTLKLSYTFGPSDRRLAFCCRHFGIDARSLHSPLQCALANAALFARYVELASLEGYTDFTELGFNLDESVYSSRDFPRIATTGRSLSRQQAEQKIDSIHSYHSSLVQMLPPASSFATARYFQKLDQALADRVLTAEEAADLLDMAVDCGLSRVQVEAIHQKYVRDLARSACLDGILTESGRQHITQVARSLGIAQYELDQIIEQAITTPHSAWGIYQDVQAHLAGKKVCFLGSLNASVEGARLSLEEAFNMAQERGLIPVEEVTRGLDYLVCDSENFASTKAQEARSRGTQVLAEPIFWKMVGVKVD